MALPNPFQRLKHGALLCKANFRTFVETFNFLVDFVQNIKGDGDGNNSGIITLDRTIPDRPVIRAKVNFDYPWGKGGGGGTAYVDNGRFKIVTKTIVAPVATVEFGNRYYRVGGRTYEMDTSSVVVSGESILVLRIGLTTGSPSPTYQIYANLAALKAAESNQDYYIMPLYKFDSDFNVVCDFRIGPDAAAWEFAS